MCKRVYGESSAAAMFTTVCVLVKRSALVIRGDGLVRMCMCSLVCFTMCVCIHVHPHPWLHFEGANIGEVCACVCSLAVRQRLVLRAEQRFGFLFPGAALRLRRSCGRLGGRRGGARHHRAGQTHHREGVTGVWGGTCNHTHTSVILHGNKM